MTVTIEFAQEDLIPDVLQANKASSVLSLCPLCMDLDELMIQVGKMSALCCMSCVFLVMSLTLRIIKASAVKTLGFDFTSIN